MYRYKCFTLYIQSVHKVLSRYCKSRIWFCRTVNSYEVSLINFFSNFTVVLEMMTLSYVVFHSLSFVFFKKLLQQIWVSVDTRYFGEKLWSNILIFKFCSLLSFWNSKNISKLRLLSQSFKNWDLHPGPFVCAPVSRRSLPPSVAMTQVTKIDHTITPFMLGSSGSAEERKKHPVLTVTVFWENAETDMQNALTVIVFSKLLRRKTINWYLKAQRFMSNQV
jgi:hypothetical protein